MAEEVLRPQGEPSKIATLPNGDIVEFFAEEHIYFVNGVYKPSVTTLLSEVGIKPDFSTVDEEKLKAASEFGTAFHAIIEDYIKNGQLPLIKSPAFKYFVEKVEPLCKEWHSETMICTDTYAGCCDLWGVDNFGNIVIVDIKTGYIDDNACKWQLSLYNKALKYSCYIPEYYNENNTKCFIYKGRNELEECDLLDMRIISQLEMQNFDIAVANGYKYICPFDKIDISSFIPFDCSDKDKFLRGFLDWKINNSLYEKFEDAIKEQAETSDKPSCLIDMPNGFYSYKKTSVTQKRFDQALFQKKCPKMYSKYIVSKTTEQIRFNKKPLQEEDLKNYEGK